MRLHNPRYTGSNRCWPCTAVNLAFLGAGTIALAALAGPTFAVATLVAGGVVITFHGYLIPGTPRLTRALPASVLAPFGKNGSSLAELPVGEALISTGFFDENGRLVADVEDRLLAAASDHLDDREDLERAIVESFDDVTETSVRRSLGGGENWFAFTDDEVTAYRWENRTVAALDVAGTALLAERLPRWDQLSAADRKASLALLRYGLRTCPACGGEYTEPDGPRVTCCGGRSLVGERRCSACDYVLVDRNDLPTDAEAAA